VQAGEAVATEKWKNFEHRVVRALRALGYRAKRTTSGRQGQEETADIEAEKDGVRLLVECKFSSRPQYAASRPVKLDWLRKLEKAARRQGRIPVLVYNYPNRGSYAVIPLGSLPDVLGHGGDAEGKGQAGVRATIPSHAQPSKRLPVPPNSSEGRSHDVGSG